MNVRWPAIALAACLIAPAALFVHDFMLVGLKVPYPEEIGLPIWASTAGFAVRLLALALIVRLALPLFKARPPLLVAAAIGLTVVMLDETLRRILIEQLILDSWPYAILDAVPKQIPVFLGVFAVSYVILRGAHWAWILAAVALVTVVDAAFVTPWVVGHLIDWRDTRFGGVKLLYRDPYPLNVNVIIYTTFIEPTGAAFILAALCWEELSESLLRRTAIFTLLLLLVRGRVVSVLLNSFWVRQPLPTAILAEGQFFLETLLLGLLVGVAWGLLKPRQWPGDTAPNAIL